MSGGAHIKQEMKEQAENPELFEPVRMYLEDPFKDYVREKYLIENPEILVNPTIMQMIYALEWYDIPRNAYTELIEYHPYLNAGDYDKLFYIKTQHQIENGISLALFTLISNRLMQNRSNLLKKRFVRFPAAVVTGGLLTYLFNLFVLRPIYLNDIQEMGLADKYFFLDLNADMMKDDLSQMGIKIDAKHFNLEKTEERLMHQEKQNEHTK